MKKVASVSVDNGGSGYTSAPTVAFSGGGGSGATGNASVRDGKVVSVAVTNGGENYSAPPSVRFSGGGGHGAQASAELDE